MTWFWVMLGSALGGLARYWLSGFAAQQISETFPIGTLIVNVTGSFIIGFFAADRAGRARLRRDRCAPVRDDRHLRRYTTFSSFSLQMLNLARDGETALAGANVALSVVLCLVGVWFGHIAASALNQFEGV